MKPTQCKVNKWITTRFHGSKGVYTQATFTSRTGISRHVLWYHKHNPDRPWSRRHAEKIKTETGMNVKISLSAAVNNWRKRGE